MRFYYINLIDANGVIFTASTYDVSYPADLLANEQRSYGWKTGNTQAAENVVFDLGSAQAATSIILLDHDLLNADTNIKIEANTTNSWGAPAFTQALTWVAGTIAQVFDSQSYRFWRLSFTKASAGVQRTIGRMFLGTYYTTTEGPADIEIDHQDLTQKQRTEGGQTWADAQADFRSFGLNFNGLGTTEKEALEAFAASVQTHKSFFFQVDENAAVDPGKLGERIYAKLISKPKFKDNGFGSDGALAWDTKLEMEEQL
jgi:hypothetical protein